MTKYAALPSDVEDDFVLDWTSATRKRSVQRIWKLINEALNRSGAHDWDVNNMEYHSKAVTEPYGIKLENNIFVVYAEQRGKKHVIALFGDDHIAAKYYVWLVSSGKVEINWALYLDDE